MSWMSEFRGEDIEVRSSKVCSIPWRALRERMEAITSPYPIGTRPDSAFDIILELRKSTDD
jgi:hypothetical protein